MMFNRIQNAQDFLINTLLRSVADESGQDLIEYALVVALIAFAATAGMNSVASNLSTAFAGMATKLSTYTS